MQTDLYDVLTEERRALLSGDFDKLESLAAAKEALLATSERQPDAPIHALFLQNARLIEAARNGVRQAREQIAEIRNFGRGFGTYNAAGQREKTGHGAELGRF